MSFEDFQEHLDQARKTSEANRAQLKAARLGSAGVKRKKDLLSREVAAEGRDNDERLLALEQRAAELDEAVGAGKESYAGALRDEWALLRELEAFTNPVENIASLEDACPILLMPLRLETRFKKVDRDGQTADQLWVRVFPDDIAINSFESDLSETEVRNARAYWLARWKAGKEDVDGNRGAWRSLASAHGPGRAYWLISDENGYIPDNVNEEPTKAPGEIILAIGVEDELLDPELSAIIAYWQAVWLADKDGALLDAAWDQLLTDVPEERATELVKDFKPANLDDPPPPDTAREDTLVRVEFVVFPKIDELEAKLHAWSQPPTASILPERFVFLAFQDRELAMPPQLGNLVPPQLILGPDPAADEGEDFRLASKEEAEADPGIDEGDLIFSENMLWMFDFDEAVSKGMGFKINLTPQQAEEGFDRVFVIGLKLGANKEKGQSLLEELFAQHQSSRKGLAIIKQGTPTNNTEEDGSGYSWRHDPDDSFDIYFDNATVKPDPLDWFNKTDGRWLAELLGIDPIKLQTVENYFGLDISEARAMQRALWPATMGHFMASMMNPVFHPTVTDITRTFFTRYITGRGPLPAIRVGRQPYGILPATNYTGMEWFAPRQHEPGLFVGPGLHGSGLNFLAFLYRILLDIDETWMKLKDKVAHVGQEGDPHQILLDIVGLHPDSVELYKRYANSLKQIHNFVSIHGLAHEGLFTYFPTTYDAVAALLVHYGYTIDSEHPVPDIFTKSFHKKSLYLHGHRIDKVPNSEVEPIGIYTTNDKNYIGWLIEAAGQSHDHLRLQQGFLEGKPPTALLYLLLHHALDESFIDTNAKMLLNNGLLELPQFQQAYIEPDFIQIESDKENESRWKYLYQSAEQITNDPDLLLGQYIAQNVDTLDEAAAFRDALAGLSLLEHVPTASLERLMMEHIDTVSYRYDSWILGFLNLQLEFMRGLRQEEPEAPARSGIYLGAYGWLEDLRPENKILTPVPELPPELARIFNPDGDLVSDASNAGYIVAPSQNHAVTAAVLRNGHLSTEDPEDKEELKIKLSSQRVRLALQIIEGIQGGQSLEALLGYRFERGLHDRTDAEVDAFIYELRDVFSLSAKKFKDTEPDPADPDYESIDQIEARNVMDGVAFLKHIEDVGIETYPFGLNDPPFNRDMPIAEDGQDTAINEVVQELIELNDAVADLALAESVHQVVLGNYERAAATLDTYSKGNFPPTPDVIKTPRSGIALTHRVALQLRTGLSHAPGPGVTPRMVAEPAVHDWLAQVMPPVDQIECLVRYVDKDSGLDDEQPVHLGQLGLAHIDLLYLLNTESDQAMSALDDLIIQLVLSDPVAYNPRFGSAIHIEYTRKQDPGKITVFAMTSLIASLRALLLKSKPLTPADAKLANEAAKENEQTLSLDPTRINLIITDLNNTLMPALAPFITDLEGLISADDLDLIVTALDGRMDQFMANSVLASRYGMTQASSGFVYDWQLSMHTQLQEKLEELIDRWERRLGEYGLLRDEYLTRRDDLVSPAEPEELFAILTKAELKIASQSTVPRPASHLDYFDDLENIKLPAFQGLLDVSITPLRTSASLGALIQGMRSVAAQLPPFDLIGLNLDDQLKQVRIFVEDLLGRAQNLQQEVQDRASQAGALLNDVTTAGDALTKVELVKNAARAIFGDDFVVVPHFSLDSTQGAEWQNTLVDSQHTLRYLRNDLDVDYPMDDWLYGASRVREKLHHLENAIFHIESFKDTSLSLVPSQFPYRGDDYWLGMQFPETIPGPEEKPFTIDEDKLLFTGIYNDAFGPGSFDPALRQCGLLIDEWTEVIPSRDETLGLTFHYDQPNTEPPQTLLLVTPSDFTGNWRWQDLVNTLHETLDMAKKRAVEPDHVDGTVYSRFLPPIVSLASPMPLTATLSLVLNNQVDFVQAVPK